MWLGLNELFFIGIYPLSYIHIFEFILGIVRKPCLGELNDSHVAAPRYIE